VVLSDGSGLAAWMHWSCIYESVIGFKSVDELYPSSPLGVDSADTSQPSKENAWTISVLPNNPARQYSNITHCNAVEGYSTLIVPCMEMGPRTTIIQSQRNRMCVL
jgi:hypothetical protein